MNMTQTQTNVNQPTRAEHLAWCKRRALEYVEAGDLHQAFSSMASDLGKHSETEGARKLCGELGMPMLLGGMLNTKDEMRRFIEGFN